MKRIGLLAGAFLLSVTGCGSEEASFEPNVFSEKDMCVVKAENSKSRICYGDSREEAEAVAGNAGEEVTPNHVSYEKGIRVFYRNDQVAAIELLEGSAEQYRTARGAKVGMPREEMIQLYGDQHMDSPGSGFLDYFYDSENKKLLTDPMKDLPPGSQEDAEKIHLVSTKLDADEHAEYMMIMDRRWAMYMD
ncbi:hypothetical protein [Saccharibacillus sacchari]|uniref:hypothetical protein n=1 Tax=Saccharibacillus sacchari TaxID=456493 RepID=UPI0004B0C670|nr:hypothetical protein [Saccharibacillus sacchari]